MIRNILWTLGILGALLLIQTTVLSYLVIGGVKPNILLIVFVLLATQNGSFSSQIVGFFLGLVVDMISNSPLGFHALQFTLAGYLFGLGSGKVYFDPLIMPIFLGLLATLYEMISGITIGFVFHLGSTLLQYLNILELFQLMINIVLAPLIFWVYGWLKEKFQNPRRGFGN